MPDAALNLSALEPLFAPHEEPNLHRVRVKDGQPAEAKDVTAFMERHPELVGTVHEARAAHRSWSER